MGSSSIFSLSGRKILVTGAAGHLGRALCEYFVSDGAIVFAVDLNEKGLESLESELKPDEGSFFAFAIDLSDEEQRAGLVEQLGAQTESLDGAVFAAAFVGSSDLEGWAVDFAHQSISTWRKALELNLTAPFHLTQLLEPLLSQGTGPSIVNIGSIYGSIGPDWSLYEGLNMSNPAAYGASKGGLIQLTRWLASTLAPVIRVNMVSPGGILRHQHADFIERYSKKAPLSRMATEQDVLGQVVFLLSAGSAYINGQNITIDGGFTAV
jgi:NAD(P)-dependent dehydrogenase (short-subunit alcohol dehydrogenase family)